MPRLARARDRERIPAALCEDRCRSSSADIRQPGLAGESTTGRHGIEGHGSRTGFAGINSPGRSETHLVCTPCRSPRNLGTRPRIVWTSGDE
eukprot:118480-Prymnesium_polylepis.1